MTRTSTAAGASAPAVDGVDTPADVLTACHSLQDFLAAHPRLVLLTGAGCSTESGIPDYRDASGAWKRSAPVQYRDFINSDSMRRRYWARSMVGFPLMHQARPNAAHRWLAALEDAGAAQLLVTQNVDGLHEAAGQRALVALHGRIHDVVCMDCRMILARSVIQERLESMNAALLAQALEQVDGPAPDGDADLGDLQLEGFRVPSCDACGGVLKPDVVFFGETVPAARVTRVREALVQADALLVMGSSLMVYSGFRFCRYARELGKPLAIVNRGTTRADELAALKIEVGCGALCSALLEAG